MSYGRGKYGNGVPISVDGDRGAELARDPHTVTQIFPKASQKMSTVLCSHARIHAQRWICLKT